jgi:hypothetical protein
MSDIDDRIRRSLDRRAASLRERPDLDGLNDRIARRDRRRMRVTSIALVLALVAGPMVGFVAGRNGSGGEVQSDVATGSNDGVMVEQSSGSLPTIPLGSAGGGAVLATSGSADGTVEYVGGAGASVPLAKAFVREVDGTSVRVYRAAVEAPAFDGPSWQQPPAYCVADGYVQADVSTDDAVGIASGSLYAELRDGRVTGSLAAVGVAEGAPMWVVVAQAPDGAANVHATFPGGQADEMEPIDGVAVLVGPASIEPGDEAEYTTTVQLEAFDTDGGSLGTGTASNGFLRYLSGENSVIASGPPDTDCSPTPQLPPPGETQPADPAAARAEIEQLFGILFSDRTDEERMADIDDPTGMLEAYDELRNGSYGEQVRGSRTVFEDLVFLSATRAAVRYHTEIPGYGPNGVGTQFGEVVLVDGRWKFTRESICQAVRLAGVSC